MNNRLKMGVLALTLVMASAFLVTAYAAPSTSKTITDVYNFLVNTINVKLDTLLGRVTADRADNLDSVSTELGSLTGVYYSYEVGQVDIANAGVAPNLARFTVTVGIYQGDADDYVAVYLSQGGVAWDLVFLLKPGTGLYATESITVVAQKILIQAYNVNSGYPGADPGDTTVLWALSAVGTPNLSLTDYT